MPEIHIDLKDTYAIKLTITVTNGGQIGVNGFPTNIQAAVDVMNAATKAIINFFLEKARNGELDELGSVIDSKVIKPDKRIITVGLN